MTTVYSDKVCNRCNTNFRHFTTKGKLAQLCKSCAVEANRKSLESPINRINRRAYERNRKQFSIQERLAANIRCYASVALRQAINNPDSNKYINKLGCTEKQLKLYLQKFFTPEMNFSNYGTVWELDHIVCLAEFNLEDKHQKQIAEQYHNLQPLSKKDNIQKRESFRGVRSA